MACKLLIVTYEASRRGGIEEVSRQVSLIAEKAENISSKVLIYKKGRISRLISMYKVMFWILLGYKPMVMHPYIFEKISFIMQLFQTKCIVWAYGIDVWGAQGSSKARSIAKASLIIAISSYTKQRILENHPKANTRIIHLSIDSENCQNKFNEKEDNQILTVGRLSSNERYKGHDLVIEALYLLKKRGVRVKYNIVGKGDDLPRLQALTKEFFIEDQVYFHGYVADEEIDEIYSRSFLFVMPSYVIKSKNGIWGGEGFGLVYLEAGLHKLPVIACNEGGQTDCIVDGETGFLVNPNPEEIAEKIELLMNDPDLAQEMGEAGYRHVQNNFSFEHFEKNVVNVIKEVLS